MIGIGSGLRDTAVFGAAQTIISHFMHELE